jgi:rhodanese-related sulfurtransferase
MTARSNEQTQTSLIDLDREQVKSLMEEGRIILVDVREPHEFAAGHIPGSVSHPLSRFDPSALPKDPERRIVLSCAAGVRSVHAAALAREAGRDVREHYLGGFKDWLAAGDPVEVE